MRDGGIDEGLLSRLILQGEAAEPVSLVLFEVTIHQFRRRVRNKLRASAFGDKERILDQQAFGEILIMQQNGSAVTGVES